MSKRCLIRWFAGAGVFCFAFLIFIGLVAGFSIEIVAIQGNFTNSVIAQSDADSLNGYDSFDFLASSGSLPSSSVEWYSNVSGNKLSIDSRPNSSDVRNISLVYNSNGAGTGNVVNLSWTGVGTGDNVILMDCGEDNSCVGSAEINMGALNKYSFNSSLVNHFFKLSIISISSIVSNPAPSTSSGGGGGGGGAGSPNVSLSDELIGILRAEAVFNIIDNTFEGGTQSFSFNNEIHSVSLKNISSNGVVEIVIKSNITTAFLKNGERKEFDLNQDSIKDIYVKILDVEGNNLKYEIGLINPKNLIHFSPPNLVVVTSMNELQSQSLTVINVGNVAFNLSIVVDALEGVVSVPDSLHLEAGESKKINVSINVDSGKVFAGKLSFLVGKQILGEVPIVMNTESAAFLFSSVISLSSNKKFIRSGEALDVDVDIKKQGDRAPLEVMAGYVIKDLEGHVYLDTSDSLLISDSNKFTKILHTQDLAPGDYVLGFTLTYPGAFSTSVLQFSVKPAIGWSDRVIALMTVFIIVLLIVAGRVLRSGSLGSF